MSVHVLRVGTGQVRSEKDVPITVKPQQPAPMGFGDMVERLAHPIAVALKLPCLDEQQKLKAESPCGKRRAYLNRLGIKVGIGRVATVLALLLMLGSVRAETNFVWIPYGNTNVTAHWWTNAIPTVVTNWQAWQAADWNFYQLWQVVNAGPQLGATNTWTGPQDHAPGKLMVDGRAVSTNAFPYSSGTTTNPWAIIVWNSNNIALYARSTNGVDKLLVTWP
jgi:hypothetical protein